MALGTPGNGSLVGTCNRSTRESQTAMVKGLLGGPLYL